MHSIEELQGLFDLAFRQQRFQEEPKELYEPFDYMIGMGGKRIRPLLLLMACEMFGKEATAALPQAIAVELFHNFTLIHDDIMDHAPLRRGLPAVHEKFSMPVAILSGDAMLVYAYKYLMQAEQVLLPELMNLFNDSAIKVCEGQQMDMNFEKITEPHADDYLKMIEKKTATLVAAALKMGAIIGGASTADAEHLYNFGLHLGISFQLKDDWLDSFGSAKKVGKQSGGDIIQNKKTFLLIEALNVADNKTREELLDWYASDQFDPSKKVSAVLAIYDKLGISIITEKQVEKHFDVALKHLAAVSIDDKQKQHLNQLTRDLLSRDR